MIDQITFKWLDDETCQIWQGPHYIYVAAHGPHGWDGMEGIIDAFTAFAELNGWEVKVEGETGI